MDSANFGFSAGHFLRRRGVALYRFGAGTFDVRVSRRSSLVPVWDLGIAHPNNELTGEAPPGYVASFFTKPWKSTFAHFSGKLEGRWGRGVHSRTSLEEVGGCRCLRNSWVQQGG